MSKAKTLSTDKLIHSIKLRASLPQSQSTFQEDDFLMFINEEMDLGVVPHVLSFHEDYFLYPETITLVAGTTRYQIPDRAIGTKLRDVTFSEGGTLHEMTRIKVEDLSSRLVLFDTAHFKQFYLEGDEIVIPETLSNASNSSLIVSYYIRPNTIVSADDVAVVTEIDTATNRAYVDKAPAVFSDVTAFDITSSKSSFRLVSKEIVPTHVPVEDELYFTFTTLPTKLVVGDVIALPEETTIPQIPVELHAMLAQRVAMRCLEALGDTQGLTSASAKLADMEAKTGSLIDNRVESSPLKIVPRHSSIRRNTKNSRGY